MLNIVLYEPEIPQNTGNIMRTCVAFHCRLHLIEPLGFYMDEKHLCRAGMDYRNELEYHIYPDWEELNTKANAVTSALSEAVVANWRDGYNAPTYYKYKENGNIIYQDALGGTSSANDLGAGLTINCSCWVPYTGNDGKTYTYQGFANWYKYDLAFGKECLAWTILIDYWWGN